MHQSLQPVWCCDKIKINNMTLLAQVQQYTDIGLEKPCSILLCNVQFWQGTVKTAQTCKYKTYGTFEGPSSYEIWSWSIFPLKVWGWFESIFNAESGEGPDAELGRNSGVMRRPAAAIRRPAAAEPEPRARGQRPDLPDGFDHFGCSKCKKQAHGCTRCKTFADKQEKGYQWLNGSIVRKVPQEAAWFCQLPALHGQIISSVLI